MRLKENTSKVFALATGQCSPNLTNTLEGQPLYKKRETRDILGLLKLIQAICCKPIFQAKDCSNEKYREDFDTYVGTIGSYGGTIEYKKDKMKRSSQLIQKTQRTPQNRK